MSRYCCLGHRAFAKEFEVMEKVSGAVPAGACWAELVTASDAFTAYLRYSDTVRESARMDGIDDDAWRAIVNGGDLDRGQAGLPRHRSIVSGSQPRPLHVSSAG